MMDNPFIMLILFFNLTVNFSCYLNFVDSLLYFLFYFLFFKLFFHIFQLFLAILSTILPFSLCNQHK